MTDLLQELGEEYDKLRQENTALISDALSDGRLKGKIYPITQKVMKSIVEVMPYFRDEFTEEELVIEAVRRDLLGVIDRDRVIEELSLAMAILGVVEDQQVAENAALDTSV